MASSSRSVPWIALFAAVAAVELVARFAFPFSLRRVLTVEALLFLGAGAATVALVTRAPRSTGWRYGLQWMVAWALALAGVRAAIWAAGQPVVRANIVILVLGVTVAAVAWQRWRSRRRSALE